MSQQATASKANDETLAGLQSLFRTAEEEFEKLQTKVKGQRKDFEKAAQKRVSKFEKATQKRVSSFEKAAQKRVSKVQKELEKTPIYQKLETIRKDASKEVEQGLDRILGSLNIATASDIKKLDRRLKQINKKLKELDEHSGGATPSA